MADSCTTYTHATGSNLVSGLFHPHSSQTFQRFPDDISKFATRGPLPLFATCLLIACTATKLGRRCLPDSNVSPLEKRPHQCSRVQHERLRHTWRGLREPKLSEQT